MFTIIASYWHFSQMSTVLWRVLGPPKRPSEGFLKVIKKINSSKNYIGLKFGPLLTLTLFIFLAQFLVTTKIKAKKLVATKNFGRDQFFCLNFGRDQKLGEEDEKGYRHKNWNNLNCPSWSFLKTSRLQ